MTFLDETEPRDRRRGHRREPWSAMRRTSTRVPASMDLGRVDSSIDRQSASGTSLLGHRRSAARSLRRISFRLVVQRRRDQPRRVSPTSGSSAWERVRISARLRGDGPGGTVTSWIIEGGRCAPANRRRSHRDGRRPSAAEEFCRPASSDRSACGRHRWSIPAVTWSLLR